MLYVCLSLSLYIYIHNTHTYIMYINICILDAINCLTALHKINLLYIYTVLGMSRSGFFALESESESFDFEYLPIPSPDPILL